MSIDVEYAPDLDRWDELVERSAQATPFHRSGVLSVVEDLSDARLHLLVGYAGEEPTGLFPLFELDWGPMVLLRSPPPGFAARYLGPILLNFGKLNYRRAVKRHRSFVEACLSFVDQVVSPDYVDVRTGPRYDDVRPFLWNDYDASPRFTYVLDLSGGGEAILDAARPETRGNVRDGLPAGSEIREGGPAAVDRVVELIVERSGGPGTSADLTADYVVALSRALPSGTLRAFTVDGDGSFAGGAITLEEGGTIYRWLGGMASGADPRLVDLLDWHVLTDAVDRGLTRYDLGDANDPPLHPRRARYAPRLERYDELSRGSPLARLAVAVHDRFGGS